MLNTYLCPNRNLKITQLYSAKNVLRSVISLSDDYGPWRGFDYNISTVGQLKDAAAFSGVTVFCSFSIDRATKEKAETKGDLYITTFRENLFSRGRGKFLINCQNTIVTVTLSYSCVKSLALRLFQLL